MSAKDETYDEVMEFLVPHYKYIMNLLLKRDDEEIEKVKENLKRTKNEKEIIFSDKAEDLNINIEELKNEKKEKWIKTLRKQVQSLIEILEKRKGI